MSDHQVNKTYEQINEKIARGEAVVVTAEEVIDLARDRGVVEAARQVDVVTTGTFAPMCSSGAFINIGQSKPVIRTTKTWFNNVPAYSGIAAVDCYLGATQTCEEDPLNKRHPGDFNYGGGHVIQDLVAGKPVDCASCKLCPEPHPPARSFPQPPSPAATFSLTASMWEAGSNGRPTVVVSSKPFKLFVAILSVSSV